MGEPSTARSAVGDVLGLASQLLNAGLSLVTVYVASLTLSTPDFAAFALMFGLVVVLSSAVRGLVGSSLLALLPVADEGEWRGLAASALGLTTGLGVLLGLALAPLALLWRPEILWFAVFLVAALYQDVARFVLLSRHRQGRALALDATWLVVQSGALVAWGLAAGGLDLDAVAVCWGLGALAGACVALGTGLRPAGPRPWVARARGVMWWFAGTTVLGQIEGYALVLLTGLLLNEAGVADLRSAQLFAAQPAVILLGSLLVLQTPRFARLFARGWQPDDVRRGFVLSVVVLLPVAALVAVVGFGHDLVLAVLLPGASAQVGTLMVVLTVEILLLAAGVPSGAALQGMGAANVLFRLQVLRVALRIPVAYVWLQRGDLVGALWAMVAVQVAHTLAVIVAVPLMSRRLLRQGAASPEPMRSLR